MQRDFLLLWATARQSIDWFLNLSTSETGADNCRSVYPAHQIAPNKLSNVGLAVSGLSGRA